MVLQLIEDIDESFLNINDYIHQHEVCEKCGGELIPVESEGVMICKQCSNQINFIIEHEKPSYKEPPKEVCFYAYKRINHFREILAQFQAKETTQIPDEVLQNIRLQIKKERITLKQMSNKKALTRKTNLRNSYSNPRCRNVIISILKILESHAHIQLLLF